MQDNSLVFLELTALDGTPLMVNINNILYIVKEGKDSRLWFDSATTLLVKEGIKVINRAMLERAAMPVRILARQASLEQVV